MADLLKQLVSGVVDAALKEVLKKTGVRKTTTKRTAGKTAPRKKASGGLLADILDAALGNDDKPAKKAVRKPTRKTVAKSSAGRTTARKAATTKSPAKPRQR